MHIPLVQLKGEELPFGEVLSQIEQNRFALDEESFNTYIQSFDNANEWHKLNQK